MKRLLFFCAILFFWGAMTDMHAQVYAEIWGIINSDRGIIREQDISYYEEASGQGHFVYLPTLLGSANQVSVPPSWSIRDFHVIDDIVYFCGTDFNGDTALLGHFNIGNLQAGTGYTVNFYRDNSIRVKMAVLNRIAVYKNKDDGCVSIMAIGRKNQGINPDMYGADQVVYIKDYGSTAGCIIRNPDELFWDVVLTDNDFVTAGYSGQYLTMHNVPIGTSLSAFPAHFNNGHKYPCIDNFVSGVRATHLINDDIVMAAYFDSHLNSDTWMHLFTITVPSAQMIYHQKHCMPVYPLATGRLLPPREMVYLPDSTALMVIDSNSLSDDPFLSHILRLTPYPSGTLIGMFYQTPYYYYSGITISSTKYNSLTKISPTCCMAATGGIWLKIDLQDPLLPAPESQSICTKSFTTDCFRDSVYHYDYLLGESHEPYNMNMKLDTGKVVNILLFNGCTRKKSE